MKSRELRYKFFDYFQERGHTLVPSSSLIPVDDPTLLFANAGMNQFKDVFLGKEKRNYTRAVSIQKCIRAGGKHNDLENVGFTKRHLTFFEMMGNFSFGDYFKKEAIIYAWEFLTQIVGLPKEKLYASVYKHDDEAYAIWRTVIGLPTERIYKLGEADNFWQMGDTGPCGPCSEIYIDRGPAFSCNSRPCGPGCHCDRFLEIWNLVFMQFDRQADGTQRLLQQTGVDTGMGLERLAAIVQDKDSVFETDLFLPLIQATEKLTGYTYSTATPELQAAFRVVADHVRSSTFAIADGCSPSNEGRGYVLRKIIRRAALFAQKLSDKPFFPQVAEALISEMGDIYPELIKQKAAITKILTSEIEKFSANLIHGQTILNKYMTAQKETKTITGAQAFKLYDTFGFPLELTKVIAQEQGFKVDTEGFEKEMEQQRAQSGKKIENAHQELILPVTVTTVFTGYDELETQAPIAALIYNNTLVNEVPAGVTCSIVPTKTPFYLEGGGQVTDRGTITVAGFSVPLQEVKQLGTARAITIQTPAALKIGDTITMLVDPVFRVNTMKNHTATHLLQGALIALLGPTVKQAGSLVTADYLRFDFTYPENLTAEQIKQVELLVNQKIMENIPTRITLTTYKDAVSKGVIAFFGEKYNPESVRVVEIPGFSAELCGGTHVRATGDIGPFKITEVSALSAGIKRIVAVTGPEGVKLFQESFATVKTLSQEFKVQIPEVLSAIKKLKDQLKKTQTELKEAKRLLIKAQIPTWQKQKEQVDSIPFLYLALNNYSNEELKEAAQELTRTGSGFYMIVSTTAERTNFSVHLTPDLLNQVDLKKFASWLKETAGLQGGGSGTSLQGGGPVIQLNLKESIKNWLEKACSSTRSSTRTS